MKTQRRESPRSFILEHIFIFSVSWDPIIVNYHKVQFKKPQSSGVGQAELFGDWEHKLTSFWLSRTYKMFIYCCSRPVQLSNRSCHLNSYCNLLRDQDRRVIIWFVFVVKSGLSCWTAGFYFKQAITYCITNNMTLIWRHDLHSAEKPPPASPLYHVHSSVTIRKVQQPCMILLL